MAKSQHGVLSNRLFDNGFRIQVGGDLVGTGLAGIEAALWNDAVERLQKDGLIEDRSGNRTSYFLTIAGYRVVEELNAERKRYKTGDAPRNPDMKTK